MESAGNQGILKESHCCFQMMIVTMKRLLMNRWGRQCHSTHYWQEGAEQAQQDVTFSFIGVAVVDNRKDMKTFSEDNIYGSGLTRKEWYIMRDILLPFLHTKNREEIEIPQVPENLIYHPFMEAIRAFKNTGKDEFLDKAGKCLVPPIHEPFGWYIVITKS